MDSTGAGTGCVMLLRVTVIPVRKIVVVAMVAAMDKTSSNYSAAIIIVGIRFKDARRVARRPVECC